MDYFLRLAQRALQPGETVARPRVASRFETAMDVPATIPADSIGSAMARPAMLGDEGLEPEHAATRLSHSSIVPGATPGVTRSSRPGDEAGPSSVTALLGFEAPRPAAGILTASMPGAGAPRARAAPGQYHVATPPVAVTMSQPAAEHSARDVAPDGRAAVADAAHDHGQRRPAETPHAAASEPVVRVSIGRIDVRAVMAPTPPAKRASPAPAQASQSLEAYLRAGKADRSKS